jgi:uncharacterized repeat protein (TIGR01451 family)
MKRFLVVALVGLGLMGMALAAGAATPRLNTCTSTYQLTGASVSPSGSDTAIVNVLTSPIVSVTKSAYNYRTAISNADVVNARAGDSVMFTISWWNIGEAQADTIILTDYVPTGLLLGTTSLGCTIYGAGATNATSMYGNTIVYDTINNAGGTLEGAVASGTFTFRVTVQ